MAKITKADRRRLFRWWVAFDVGATVGCGFLWWVNAMAGWRYTVNTVGIIVGTALMWSATYYGYRCYKDTPGDAPEGKTN